MTARPLQILFLCTGNSCRSIMAEAIVNHFGKGLMCAASAGSQPTGRVHPIALTCLEHNQIPTGNPRSKSWNEFTGKNIDLVITVCDNAAGESCPLFPGTPAKLHWGLRDPATAEGTPEQIFKEFQRVFDQLQSLTRELIAGFEQQPEGSVHEWLKHVDFHRLITNHGNS